MRMTAQSYKVLRDSLFTKLKQSQVDGIERLVRASEVDGLTYPETAYLLATVYHETGEAMQPVVERGSVSYFDKYDTGTLAKNLGNTTTKDGDGYKYRGRGDVQITGGDNYRKFGKLLDVDLFGKPDLALDPTISAKIAVLGMRDGLFTGVGFRKKRPVGHYDKAAYTKARAIINGTDKAGLIADYAMVFEKALRS